MTTDFLGHELSIGDKVTCVYLDCERQDKISLPANLVWGEIYSNKEYCVFVKALNSGPTWKIGSKLAFPGIHVAKLGATEQATDRDDNP